MPLAGSPDNAGYRWLGRVSTAIGVSLSPGKMQLARMPYGAFCRASCSVKAIIAALVALCDGHRGDPLLGHGSSRTGGKPLSDVSDKGHDHGVDKQ